MSKEEQQQHITSIGGQGGYGGRNDERTFKTVMAQEKAN